MAWMATSTAAEEVAQMYGMLSCVLAPHAITSFFKHLQNNAHHGMHVSMAVYRSSLSMLPHMYMHGCMDGWMDGCPASCFGPRESYKLVHKRLHHPLGSGFLQDMARLA